MYKTKISSKIEKKKKQEKDSSDSQVTPNKYFEPKGQALNSVYTNYCCLNQNHSGC